MKIQDLLDYGFKITREDDAIFRIPVGPGEPVYDALMTEFKDYNNHEWMDTNEIMEFQDKNNLPVEYIDSIETLYEKSHKFKVRYYNNGICYSGNTLTEIRLYKDARGKRYLMSYKDIMLEIDIVNNTDEISRLWEHYSYKDSFSSCEEFSPNQPVNELIDAILNRHKREKRLIMNEFNKKIKDLKKEYRETLNKKKTYLSTLEELGKGAI